MAASVGVLFDWGIEKNIRVDELTQEEKEEVARVRQQKENERKKKQGLTLWYIRGVRVWALNSRNALRKVEKVLKEVRAYEEDKAL